MIDTVKEPCDDRRAIAAHFAGRGSPVADTAMRAHVGGCAPCRRYYDRALMLASLDPRGHKARERIARGLGLRAATRPTGRRNGRIAGWLAAGALVPAAAVALTLLVHERAAPRLSAAAAPPAEFTSRGAPADERSPAPAVWIYRVGRDGAVRLVDGTIRADDELAFAYSNTARQPYLLIFGVDEHRHVYWFHPAWPVGAAPPSAVRAAPGPGPFELPEAIRPHTDGRQLTIYALLSRQSITVETVEAAIRRAGPSALATAFGAERPVVVSQALVVQP
jgi:hypothetical protein